MRDDEGMYCRSCGGRTYVMDSRQKTKSIRGRYFKERICRRRACSICGQRFSTLEVRSEELDRLIYIDATLTRIYSQVTK